MLREKYNSLTNKRGYLYIRETIYKRDKRTLKRKPSKLCDGNATKNRWKYSIKKDTYCGKIIEDIELKKIITFKDYLQNKLNKINNENNKEDKCNNYNKDNRNNKYNNDDDNNKNKMTEFDYIKYLSEIDFDNLLDDFAKYILTIYDLNEDDFLNGKKKVYHINNGFFSKETIEWVRRFKYNKKNNNLKEFERFSNRCLDSGIFDEEIIKSLYLKLVPNDYEITEQSLNSEIMDDSSNKIKQIKINKLRNFIANSIEKD